MARLSKTLDFIYFYVLSTSTERQIEAGAKLIDFNSVNTFLLDALKRFRGP